MIPFELGFVIAATILCGLAFVIWKRSDWFNTLLKIVLFFMTVWGVLILYDQHLF
jgi:hypothetical protein